MYEFVKGKLIDVTFEKAVVEAGGIGYQIHIPFNAFSKLPHRGNEVLFYTAFIVREDSQRLFGFLTMEERTLFKQLETISGIGPKTALTLVGHLEGVAFQRAIAGADTTTLCKVPGIGKKTAERLIIEMRDKIKKLPTDLPLATGSSPTDILSSDAVSALVNLGYPSAQAQKAVKKVIEKNTEKLELTELITATLRSF